MSSQDTDQADKSFEPTPQKLQQAREKGEFARSTDLSVAAAYLGLLVVFLAVGSASVREFGSGLLVFLNQPDQLTQPRLDGSGDVRLRGSVMSAATATLPWFLVPALAVLLSILAQRAFVVTPSKLAPKLSRISLISNAKQKFGRNGWFEFFKSFTKLLLYSVCLAVYIRANLSELIALAGADPAISTAALGHMGLEFLGIATVIALGIGGIDALWQHAEHRRKNRMTRQELMDETKSTEGDPHLKQARRQRGQEIARNQMLADVPGADVVIVNPTHYAVALQWSRQPGSAPVCVAKGTDEIALRIREIASQSGVPLHSDPPTARALHAAVGIGEEITSDQYRAVAAAIRFADDMRRKAREAGL